MKIFISWSGNVSREVGTLLRDWIPNVIQAAKPWMSEHDVESGARWAIELAKVLEQYNFGITCLTRGNFLAPWILYEAGALTKELHESAVVPYLYQLEPTEVTGPLSQFQARRANKSGTKRVIETINKITNNGSLDDKQLELAFEKWWPDLETGLDNISTVDEEDESSAQRNERDLIVEVLDIVRSLRRMEGPESKYTTIHPAQSGAYSGVQYYQIIRGLSLRVLEVELGNLIRRGRILSEAFEAGEIDRSIFWDDSHRIMSMITIIEREMNDRKERGSLELAGTITGVGDTGQESSNGPGEHLAGDTGQHLAPEHED